MVNTILGRKIGMTQVWDDQDNVVPVTVILAGPCTVSQVKTTETDGYEAIQVGFGEIPERKVNMPMAGHFAKAGVSPMRYLREFRVEDASVHSVGDVLTVEAFPIYETKLLGGEGTNGYSAVLGDDLGLSGTYRVTAITDNYVFDCGTITAE